MTPASRPRGQDFGQDMARTVLAMSSQKQSRRRPGTASFIAAGLAAAPPPTQGHRRPSGDSSLDATEAVDGIEAAFGPDSLGRLLTALLRRQQVHRRLLSGGESSPCGGHLGRPSVTTGEIPDPDRPCSHGSPCDDLKEQS